MVAARMDDVAARAGVSKGTLYRFFESKEELFLATLLESYEAGLRLVGDELARPREPRERLAAYLEGLVGVLSSLGPDMHVHYQAWGVVAGEPVHQSRLYGFLRDFHAERDAELSALIREGQEAGAFRPDLDVRAMATGMNALLGGFLYRSSFDPAGARPETLRACLQSLLAQVLEKDDRCG